MFFPLSSLPLIMSASSTGWGSKTKVHACLQGGRPDPAGISRSGRVWELILERVDRAGQVEERSPEAPKQSDCKGETSVSLLFSNWKWLSLKMVWWQLPGKGRIFVHQCIIMSISSLPLWDQCSKFSAGWGPRCSSWTSVTRCSWESTERLKTLSLVVAISWQVPVGACPHRKPPLDGLIVFTGISPKADPCKGCRCKLFLARRTQKA